MTPFKEKQFLLQNHFSKWHLFRFADCFFITSCSQTLNTEKDNIENDRLCCGCISASREATFCHFICAHFAMKVRNLPMAKVTSGYLSISDNLMSLVDNHEQTLTFHDWQAFAQWAILQWHRITSGKQGWLKDLFDVRWMKHVMESV